MFDHSSHLKYLYKIIYFVMIYFITYKILKNNL
jgi:hypothetical protein